MSSEDTLASTTKGVTKALLEYGEEKLKALITKFRNRELVFVQDPDTIRLVKDQRKTPEWELFTRYVDHKGLRILFLMGLTLRYLEKEGKPIDTLIRRIKKRYGSEGLHFAFFAQNGFFGKLVANIIEREPTSEKLKTEIENLLSNIEKTVVFVDSQDNIARKTREIVTRIDANAPKIFILSSIRSAMGKCRIIKINVMKEISGYTVEQYKTENREVYFLNKSDKSPDS